MCRETSSSASIFSTFLAFGIVSFFLGELGDGLNIFQGIYLVNIGWNEGAVGIALSLMGFTALICQTFAGDLIDKAERFDRRNILILAALITACSALAILFVKDDGSNEGHGLMYVTKVIEGIASSFIQPCLAALTLANYGDNMFDVVMANNVLWGHIGSAVSAILAGGAAYWLYPNIKSCFYVIALSAFFAILFLRFIPEGDPKLGRGLKTKSREDLLEKNDPDNYEIRGSTTPTSYLSVLSEPKTLVLCLTGFSFHLSNANVLLVLGELMSQNDSSSDDDDDVADNEEDMEISANRNAIPLICGAFLLAQATMSIATAVTNYYTKKGTGRKILFLLGLLSLPIRCALLLYWIDAGNTYLLSTQILDGLGGGFFGILHPYIVADITFGTGRFNLIMGLTASCFGLGATFSNLLGQHLVEHMGHAESLMASLITSFIPIIIFAVFMPETLHTRGNDVDKNEQQRKPEIKAAGSFQPNSTIITEENINALC